MNFVDSRTPPHTEPKFIPIMYMEKDSRDFYQAFQCLEGRFPSNYAAGSSESKKKKLPQFLARCMLAKVAVWMKMGGQNNGLLFRMYACSSTMHHSAFSRFRNRMWVIDMAGSCP